MGKLNVEQAIWIWVFTTKVMIQEAVRKNPWIPYIIEVEVWLQYKKAYWSL